MPDDVGRVGATVALAVAVLALARELGYVPLPLPQIGRQTQGLWAKRYGARVSAALWGLDLGLTFTTWLGGAGAWVLAVVTFVVGEPVLGAALFVGYWLGRALPVWVGPLLMRNATDAPVLMESLETRNQQRLFRAVHVAGVVWSVAVIAIWLVVGTPN